MSLSVNDVKKIAKLARIRVQENEIEHFQKEITSILNWVEMLQEVNTDNVPQMASVSNIALVSREDKVTDGGIQQEVLQNAPDSQYGFFVVPKVVE